MGTGMFCHTAERAASGDVKTVVDAVSNEKKRFVAMLESIFSETTDGRRELSVEDFERVLSEPKMISFLGAIDVEAEEAWSLFKVLDVDMNGLVDADEFISGCLRMKGGAIGLDVAEVKYQCTW